MNDRDLRALFQEYERQARQENKEIAALRENALGILKPEVIRDHVSRRQGIVLAYGMLGEVSYSLTELRKFLKALDAFQKQPHISGGQGVPYAKIFTASRPVDIERAKTVRNATLYQRKGNILFFQVSGNSRLNYRVQYALRNGTIT